MARFADIKQFTREGSWECSFEIDRVWNFIREQEKWDGAVDIDPDFQRPHRWTEAQQIAWVEFFLRGGKTGRVIYFNHPGWRGSYEGVLTLVDGKQRLEAIRRFLADEIRAFGALWSEYEDKPRSVVNNIKINVNTLATRAEVIQWYIEMNAGGTPHSEAEIEHAREILRREVAK